MNNDPLLLTAAPDNPAPSPTVKKAKGAPKWQTDANERIKAAIKNFAKPIADLCSRDANEGDTRLIVTDFLSYGLGYDKYNELTTEYRVKNEFADFGVRIEQQMLAFIEVKRVNTKLSVNHLRQVQNYALNEGVEWVVLTNGHEWQVYRITLGLPVETHLVHEADMLSDQTSSQKVAAFFLLTREALKRGMLDQLWLARRATSPQALKEILCSAAVLDAARKEIKKKNGQNIDNKGLMELLVATVFKEDCFQKTSIL